MIDTPAELRGAVRSAIETLGTGLVRHPANGELRRRLARGEAVDLADYHRALLRVVYRLLFLILGDGGDPARVFEDTPGDIIAGAALVEDDLLEAAGHLARAIDRRNLEADELGEVYEGQLDLVPCHDPRTGTFTVEPGPGNGRRTRGAYYTPSSLIDRLLDATLDPLLDEAENAPDPVDALLQVTVCDPACGSGRFLVAAARRIAERLARARADGGDPTPRVARSALQDVVGRCIYGVDVDPMATELTKASLWLESIGGDQRRRSLDAHVKVGNALLGATAALVDQGMPVAAFAPHAGDDGDGPESPRARADAWCAAFLVGQGAEIGVVTDHHLFHWHLEFPEVFTDAGGFSCVVGNPPFLSPLVTSGSRVTRERNLTKFVRGGLGGPKADESSYFLLLASDLVGRGGRLGLVLPDSFLSSSDSAPIREAIGARHDLAMIWRGDGSEFEASVTTIMVSLAPKGIGNGPTRLVGPDFEPIIDGAVGPWGAGSWSPLVARSEPGASALLTRAGPTMGHLCTITADYRDQYYGLRGAVYDAPAGEEPHQDEPALVTTGLIDPLVCSWGQRSTRFDHATYRRPLVRLTALSPRLERWARARLVPKLLVATQGKMVELVIDVDGRYLPCVPVISVLPAGGGPSLAELAAIFLSPASFEYFRMTKLGAGLSPGAIKVSASDLRAMPAPVDPDRVAVAGTLLDRLHDPSGRAEFRRLMNAAYALPPAIGAAWDATIAAYVKRSRPSRSSSSFRPVACSTSPPSPSRSPDPIP